jgi:hypothetical protein
VHFAHKGHHVVLAQAVDVYVFNKDHLVVILFEDRVIHYITQVAVIALQHSTRRAAAEQLAPHLYALHDALETNQNSIQSMQ